MSRSLGSGEKRLLLAGVVGLVSISGLIVGNWALRQISEGLAVPSADRERFVKERERRFCRAMNMGSMLDGDDENP